MASSAEVGIIEGGREDAGSADAGSADGSSAGARSAGVGSAPWRCPLPSAPLLTLTKLTDLVADLRGGRSGGAGSKARPASRPAAEEAEELAAWVGASAAPASAAQVSATRAGRFCCGGRALCDLPHRSRSPSLSPSREALHAIEAGAHAIEADDGRGKGGYGTSGRSTSTPADSHQTHTPHTPQTSQTFQMSAEIQAALIEWHVLTRTAAGYLTVLAPALSRYLRPSAEGDTSDVSLDAQCIEQLVVAGNRNDGRATRTRVRQRSAGTGVLAPF
eukprot:CAMPEP_0181242364 /NCGR_PEP_ID=MMETSP1096-20121128/41640_1 /TAXON_ID=156174 ORGANISM="Chrysochromulina ericina, Strain CCMP281" /NCGR_SAMPLE_ID=MMETSP1096 /ASSEMBLY_ACC=CAM_ASM_000453 /LENGTH=274 /DNA_ID=CAMNT_0023338547 /DNA_START=248 /DNA_END=1073 /DNA_ORIENTATION=+